jgi:hypothetical protein
VGAHERGWRRVGDVVIVLAVVAVLGLAFVAVVRQH